MSNSFTRFRSLFLLGGLLLSSVVSSTFLYGSWIESEAPQLVPNAKSSDELVEKLKKLDSGERSIRVAAQIGYLASEPLDIDAINNISTLQALGDNVKQSESIVVEAAKRSLRDVQSQLSALNILLRKREYEQALFHMDGLLRSRPKLAEQLFKVLSQLRLDPQGLTSVASLLKESPPWRGTYLGSVLKDDETGQATFQLLSGIRKSGGSVSNDEMRTFIATQISKKNFELAYFTWLDSLDAESLKSVSFIYDGKFERAPHNLYFDWTLHAYPNANINVTPKPGDPANQVLRLDFTGGRDAFWHVQQYLKLAPGEYDVSGEWRAENFQSPSGLRWEVYCAGGATIGASRPILKTTRTSEIFSFAVIVPFENCDTQLLQLQSASVAILDQRFDGQIYFDNLSVVSKSSLQTKVGE